MQLAMEQGLLKFVRAIPQSRAAKSGLRSGDIVLRLNGQPITGLTISQAVAHMRGPVDSMVRIAIRRKNQSAPIEMLVARELIRVDTVSSRIVSGNVGYIGITKFNGLTTEGLQRALEDIWARVPGIRLKGFVLDLRNNPGGLLEQAISVSEAFLDSGTIVSIYGRNIEDNKTYVTSVSGGDLGRDRPLIVLINGGSASAAEIVAGALQGDDSWHPVFRKGVCAIDIADRRWRGAKVDYWIVLHAEWTLDSGERHCSRHRSDAGGAGVANSGNL